MKRMMLSLFLSAAFPALASAGPLREWIAARQEARAERRAGNQTCTVATPAAAVPAKAEPKSEVKAAPPVAASSCPGGVCPAPSARRGILGFRR